MKFLVLLFPLVIPLLHCGCEKASAPEMLRFAAAADYPPFGYVSKGEIVGFEIDLARLVAQKLGKCAIFQDMAFAAVLPALKVGRVDVAVATITATAGRAAAYDFSESYFHEELFAVFRRTHPLAGTTLEGRKLACQLGTTMEIWLRENVKTVQLVPLDNVGQAVEALKSGLVEGVIIDGFQAREFCKHNGDLDYCFVAKSTHGYAMAFAKNSPLLEPVNIVLKKMNEDGTIQELRQRWGLDGTL